MSEARSQLADQAGELRRLFDRAFAEPVRGDVASTDDLLAFRIGSEPYALRLTEIAGLFAGRRISRLPGSHGAFLGLVGFRGSIVPAYDLQVLLGRPALDAPRWLAVASAALVAFAFETFEGHLRVPRDAIMPRQASERSNPLIREFAPAAASARPIVHLPSVLDAVQSRLAGDDR